MDCLKPYQKLGVDFLYRNYKKNLNGAILNEENDMNMRLQVGMFLNLIYNRENILNKFFILILCPDNFMFYWHYHLINDCKFSNVKILNEDNFIDENDTSPSIRLLSFSLLKLCTELQHFQYFAVIIDNFDEIALKRYYRKLSGDFNIGLTYRNFYMNPNLKLQWNMLNWINPGCVGKYNDFLTVYRENIVYFPLFWYQITWSYCDSFKKLTEKEKNVYHNQIIKWSNKCGIEVNVEKLPSKRKLKRNNEVDDKKQKIDYKPLPTMDESPILTSIIKNFNTIPDPQRTYKDNNKLIIFPSKQSECNNGIFASTSKSINNDDFLKSFILNDINPTSATIKADKFSNDDIELLLQDTDKLLNG